MQRLFDVLGVDYAQWKALTKTALKLDLRASNLAKAQFQAQAKAVTAYLGLFVFYTAMGAGIAVLVWTSRDVFLSGLVVLTYVMFMVATAALLDHSSAITSPDDYSILGFRPIASRTYFAARLANVLVYTIVMTTVFAYLPMLAYFTRHGFVLGTVSVVAVYAASAATALAIMASYGWLLRAIGPARLRRTLSYTQFVFSFLVYGGFFMMSQFLSARAIATFELTPTPWLLLYPPAWFASYFGLAGDGDGNSPFMLAAAALSVISLIGLSLALRGRLSLEYADRLGAISTMAAPARRKRSARQASWFRAGEARAVALLIRGQFRNDMKFRMGVLTILPLTLIYLLMGVKDGGVGDPFKPGEVGRGLSMVTIAVLMFPAMLKMNLVRSDAYRASWVFFSTPADRARVVRSSKDILVTAFLLPYLAAVGAILAYFSTNVLHVLVHLVVIALLSHVVLQVVTLLEPELPFSKPMVKTHGSTRVFAIMVVVVIMAAMLPYVAPMMYRSTIATAGAIVGLVLISVGIDRVTRLRVEAQAAELEFEG